MKEFVKYLIGGAGFAIASLVINALRFNQNPNCITQSGCEALLETVCRKAGVPVPASAPR